MALPTTNGILDTVNSKIVAPSSLTWDELGAADSAGLTRFSSWDEWTNWTGVAETPLTWFTDIVDLSDTGAFNLTWNISCVGTPTFTVYTSNTGTFTGEETTTTVNVGDSNVAAFEGRFVGILISVAETSEGIPEILSFDFTATGNRLDIQQFDIASSDLNGSSSARQINMPRNVSKVLGMNITAQASNYVEDSYVASDYIEASAPGFPVVVSKTRSAPEVTFVNNSGSRVDATFDITITCLPEQYMDENNMAVR